MTVSTRRARQLRIASLLDELEERRRHLYRLQAGGALPAGLRDLKHELAEAAGRLQETLAA
jgi:hypothetical protein